METIKVIYESDTQAKMHKKPHGVNVMVTIDFDFWYPNKIGPYTNYYETRVKKVSMVDEYGDIVSRPSLPLDERMYLSSLIDTNISKFMDKQTR